jgi:hypothetical protein
MPPVPDCPICGRPLRIDDVPLYWAEAAPWTCDADAWRFWNEELTPQARSLHRPTHGDWGWTQQVPDAVQVELSAAHARGTSVHQDHLSLLSDAQLDILANRNTRRDGETVGLHPDFAYLLGAEQAKRTRPTQPPEVEPS